MKKVLALSIAIVLVLSASAFAGQEPARPQDPQASEPAPSSEQAQSVSGTISSLDNDQKMLVLRDDSGKEITVYWNDATRVSGGDLKEGASVSLQTTDQGGKTFATSIEVRTKKSY